MTRKHTRLWLVAFGFLCVAWIVGLTAMFLNRIPKTGSIIEPPPVARLAPSALVMKPAEQAATQNSQELQSLQKAMMDCDKEAAQNPENLYLLIVPVSPNTDQARVSSPEGEAYQTYFLMTSKEALSGLEAASYAIDPSPFIFTLIDPSNGVRKNWNLVSGIAKLTHRGPEQFREFRVGFDQTGRGSGIVWSKIYSRQPSVCYWINVRFRVSQFDRY